MASFLRQLAGKNYQNKKVGIIENGTWAPSAARVMLEIIDGMKNVEVVESKVTIRTTLKDENLESLETLADSMLTKK